ncbi:MAG: hypothetical protein C5B56_01685 [Proteobacteria bacterium]|nr:MAG: hypothetical protein C5B56_01685 [Pseudomonadota bacterium]
MLVLVLFISMTGNWIRHGRFEIGSFAGVALLGKGLLLLEAEDVPALPPRGRASGGRGITSAHRGAT